jgi:type IV pilus assembly protein PilM
MARFKRSKGKRLILDLGSSTVRLCELSQTKSGYQLTRYLQREFVIDPSLDEEAANEIRNDALQELLKEAKVRAKKVVFGVPGQSVFTRPRALPPVPEHKVTQIVRYEIRQQIPFDLDQIALDFQILGKTEAGGYDVLMAAIKVDVVEQHLDMIRAAKKSIDVVDVTPLAAYNWFKYTGEFGDQGECVALLDLGASTTDIVVEREGQLRFLRSLNLGGNNITSAIATSFGVEFADAERMKRERGFAPSGNPERDGKGGQVIGQVLTRLVAEINRSLAYFRSQPGGGTVSRIIVTGGGACLRNIIPYLQQHLGIEVRIGQPLAGLAIAPEAQEVNEHPERASVVLGLALRTCDDVAVAINLIPPRILQAAKRREQAFYWAMSFFALSLIVASIVPVSAQRDKQVQRDIKTVEDKIVAFDPLLRGDLAENQSKFEGALQNRRAQIQKSKQQCDFLDALWTRREFWLKYITAVSEARPRSGGLWFSDIETSLVGGKAGAPRAIKAPTASAQQEAEKNKVMFSEAELARMEPQERRRAERKMAQRQEAIDRGEDPDMIAVNQQARGAAFISPGFTGILQAGNQVVGGAPQGTGTPPPEVNGLIVVGYAKDPKIILEFVENLKAQAADPEVVDSEGVWRAEGVYFNESTVELASFRSLWAAQTLPEQITQNPQPVPGEERVYTFRVDLQFSGPSFKESFDKAMASAAGYGLSSSNRQSLEERREERREDRR